MNIKKIGHCCLLIELDNLTILTDPGYFSVGQNSIVGIDVVLITHEHGDHLHIESLQEILKNNPHAQVVTNSAVGKKLDALGDGSVRYTILEGVSKTEVKNVSIEASDGKHEEVFEQMGQVQNTGYFIADTLFYPGDSFHNPGRSVDVLALPVSGPWCKISDAIRYALDVKPKRAFPVHDAMIKKEFMSGLHQMLGKILVDRGIEFCSMDEGDQRDF